MQFIEYNWYLFKKTTNCYSNSNLPGSLDPNCGIKNPYKPEVSTLLNPVMSYPEDPLDFFPSVQDLEQPIKQQTIIILFIKIND